MSPKMLLNTKIALAFIDKTSRDFAIPQDVLNKQFTQLSASVIGAGGDINLAQEAFIGIAAGIRGTGGSLADMEGALRATAQVFSKGKVSAEELASTNRRKTARCLYAFCQINGQDAARARQDAGARASHAK
jgi:hypothetical protein